MLFLNVAVNMAKVHFLMSALYILLTTIPLHRQEGLGQIVRVTDYKDFKKLLRTKTNVLCIYAELIKEGSSDMKTFDSVAKEVAGRGTVAVVECRENKKLCKRLDAGSPSPYIVKHYKNGNFDKNYAGPLAPKSMVNLMLGNTGHDNWDEDPKAKDVVHIREERAFDKLLKKDKRQILAAFYEQRSVYWERFKSEFASAATMLKGQCTFVGVDLKNPKLQALRARYNITENLTVLYFKNGTVQFEFGSEANANGIVDWLKSPFPKTWARDWEKNGSAVVHLSDKDFEQFISKTSSVLVFFYEPWCRPCRALTSELDEAALQINDDGVGAVAAVNTKVSRNTVKKYNVKFLPYILFFKDGQYVYDVVERSKEEIIEFMKDPHPRREWKDEANDIVHLTEDTYKPYLQEKRHALVMSYLPWSDGFKKAQPEFTAAAAYFKNETKVGFAAIDCSVHATTCASHHFTAFDVFYFKFGEDRTKFPALFEKDKFITFIKLSMSRDVDDHWNVEGKENVHHLTDKNFDAFILKQSAVLVLFYALWCSHCKTMMPAYAEAATILEKEGHAGKLAAVDATIETQIVSRYRPRGYPELFYFHKGRFAFKVDDHDPRTAENLVSILKNPKDHIPKQTAPAVVEKIWSEVASDIKFLTTSTFDEFIEKEKSVLVMFYSPTCTHSKNMRAPFEAAAAKLKTELPSAKLAAVDATVEKDLLKKFSVTGFPTIKYFQDGKLHFDYSGNRTEEGIIEFLKVPKAPKAKSTKEPDWNTVPSAVNHLTKDTYSEFLEKHEAVLVMFYAPWCKISKKTRPDFQSAADEMRDNLEVDFAAVDCTKHNAVCKKAGAKKYPTIKLFVNGEFSNDFDRDRTKDNFIDFMKNAKTIEKDEL